LPSGLRDAGAVADQLGQGLVHAGGGGGNIRAYTGDPRKLEKSLYRAVLSVLPVEHRENHVNGPMKGAICLKDQKPLSPYGGNGGRAVVLTTAPLPCGKQAVVLAPVKDPFSLTGNAHGENIVFFRI
jgi:hypothetical protein